ncbi:MAG: septal ring lytic transglycosylase RlpA family protein [Nitrospirae bacterium]|nr:septal ring lytic transglycosylase RlpA family protein [Nitrospirota bacterium]
MAKLVLHYFLVIGILFFIASCAAIKYETYPDIDHVIASWYGHDFHGKPTASGEIFDMYAMTCAHRKYPFGTKLRVTNPSNNKKAYCTVNDRGPFVSGRDIDLSYAVAKEIGLMGLGVGRVKVEYLGKDTSYIREVKYLSDTGPFTVQVGSFRDLSNAARLKKSLELNYGGVYITEAEIYGNIYYRVRIGKYYMRDDVCRLAKTLADEGYSVFVTGYEEKI